MNALWTYLSRWGGPLAILAVVLLLGSQLWTGWNLEGNPLLKALRWVGYWWIAIILGAWFLYAFTNMFPGNWNERTEGKGVVWEGRSSMVSFSYVFAIFILLSPL